MELSLVNTILDFSTKAGSQAVLILIVILLSYLLYKKDAIQKEKDQIIIDLIKTQAASISVLEEAKNNIQDLQQEIRKNSEIVLSNIGKINIPEGKLIYMIKRVVLSASVEKIQFLVDQLELDDIEHNQEEKKRLIKAELTRISRDTYIDFLDNFTCKRGSVGSWIYREFSIDNFLDEIYRIFFNKKMSIYKKERAFLQIIKNSENELWEKFKIYLDYGEF